MPRNAGGSRLGQATVAAYPMLQNVTSIPVLAILIRCNLTLRNGQGFFGCLSAVKVGIKDKSRTRWVNLSPETIRTTRKQSTSTILGDACCFCVLGIFAVTPKKPSIDEES